MNTKNKKTDTSNPHEKHRERFRARYIKSAGLDGFADHEVLEFLLYYAIRRMNTNKIAHRVLKEFGSLHNLFEASPKQISSRTGLSEVTAVLISLVPHLAKRYQYDKWDKRIVFNNSAELGNYAKIPFIGHNTEHFYMLCLDKNFMLRGMELLEADTIDYVELYPRKIVDYALMNKSYYVVLAHNHPSGDKSISQADLDATVSIRSQLEPFNIIILDHILVAGDEYISFAERKLLQLLGVDGAKKLWKEGKG